MSPEEKGLFCQVMASLFSPPDQEILRELEEGGLYPFFKNYVEAWGEKESILKGLLIDGDPLTIFNEIRSEYHRLFDAEAGGKISLVESFYKPWTFDPLCPLPFAKEKGFLMSDSAIHLLALYQHCGLEVSGSFKGTPDHLAVALEFLSFLYQHARDSEIQKVIEDHFDWVPLLHEEMQKAHAHPFYLTLIEVLQLFLHSERKRWENGEYGEKKIYSAMC